MKSVIGHEKMNVAYVHRQIPHHASHSGYHIVFERMGIKKAYSNLMKQLSKLIPGSLRWRLHLLRPQPVGDAGLDPEIMALPFVRSKDKGVCHFIYGEDTYFFTSLWRNKTKKILATYHYPPQLLVKRVSPPILKTLDAVMIVASNQRAFFSEYFPDDRIFLVHHHVDTEFFCPENDRPVKREGRYRIVSVGGILRDMELLSALVECLTEKLGVENVEFDFLIPESAGEQFKSFSNVKLHSKISDEALRELYRNATLGLMPLEDCTANNAVLEMMACGKAIVCSDVGGISDYLDGQGALLYDYGAEVSLLADTITDLMIASDKLEKMGQYNREKALSCFSLSEVSKKISRVYGEVLKVE